MNKVCLVSTLHDPDNKLLGPAFRYYRSVRRVFSEAVVKMTEATDWEKLPETTVIKHSSKPALGRLMALGKALEVTNCNLFFYCDFDRLLYWYVTYPNELQEVVTNPIDELTVIGRSPSAFETHPKLQRLTEAACNNIFSYWLGKEIDILSGCRIIPRGIAEKIITKSKPKNIAQVDAEWLMIAGQKSLKYFEVNGLGYEHSLFGLDKPVDIEVRTRVENLNAIMECVLNDG